MRPNLSENNFADCRLADAKHLSDVLLPDPACAKESDIQDLGSAQLGSAVFLANVMASFLHRVLFVLHVRTENQMLGVDARLIVASMHHDETVRNWSLVDLIGEPMRVVGTFTSTCRQLAVSRLMRVCSPSPAIRSFFDFFPKSFCDWPSLSCHSSYCTIRGIA